LVSIRNNYRIALRKNRWEIGALFQENQTDVRAGLNLFLGQSREGHQNQVWMVLIANLIFSVIQKGSKRQNSLRTLVSMAKQKLIS